MFVSVSVFVSLSLSLCPASPFVFLSPSFSAVKLCGRPCLFPLSSPLSSFQSPVSTPLSSLIPSPDPTALPLLFPSLSPLAVKRLVRHCHLSCFSCPFPSVPLMSCMQSCIFRPLSLFPLHPPSSITNAGSTTSCGQAPADFKDEDADVMCNSHVNVINSYYIV